MTYGFIARYKVNSYWELDFDLNKVEEWYVRWDTLYVKFRATDNNFIEIKPFFSASMDPYSYQQPIYTEFYEE